MGHEVAGQISAVGAGVTGWQVGDRVGVCPTTPFGAPGFVTDGGFGEKVRCPASALVRIPDNVSYALGAVGTGAGMTSHAAVVSNGQVKAGDTMGIIGFGGLGQIGAGWPSSRVPTSTWPRSTARGRRRRSPGGAVLARAGRHRLPATPRPGRGPR